MKIKELVSKICLAEGKKLQEHVGNVREVIAILSDMIYEDSVNNFPLLIVQTMFHNGCRRVRAKNKKKDLKRLKEFAKNFSDNKREYLRKNGY